MARSHEDAARLSKAIKVADRIWQDFLEDDNADHDVEWLERALRTDDPDFWGPAAEAAGTRPLSEKTVEVVRRLVAHKIKMAREAQPTLAEVFEVFNS